MGGGGGVGGDVFWVFFLLFLFSFFSLLFKFNELLVLVVSLTVLWRTIKVSIFTWLHWRISELLRNSRHRRVRSVTEKESPVIASIFFLIAVHLSVSVWIPSLHCLLFQCHSPTLLLMSCLPESSRRRQCTCRTRHLIYIAYVTASHCISLDPASSTEQHGELLRHIRHVSALLVISRHHQGCDIFFILFKK